MKNEVKTTEIRIISFKNPTLQKYMQNIDKAQLLGIRSAVTIAENAVAILEKDCWREDFATEKDFAEYIGIKKGTLSQWKGAIEYNRIDKDAKKLGYSLRKSYELGKLLKAEELQAFREWCLKNKVDTGTDSKLLDAINKFHGKLTKAEKKQTQDADVVSESEDVKAVNSSDTAGGKKMVCLEYNGKTYSIPVKEFKAFLEDYSE